MALSTLSTSAPSTNALPPWIELVEQQLPASQRPALRALARLHGPEEAYEALHRGFDPQAIAVLTGLLDVSLIVLAKHLGVSDSTLKRRSRTGEKLNLAESDHTHRLWRVTRSALEFFDGEVERARGWLKRPNRALGGRTPLEFSDTDIGAHEVIALLDRLAHGVVT